MKVAIVLALTCVSVVLLAYRTQAEPATTEPPVLCGLVCPNPLPIDVVLKPFPDDCEAYCQCSERGAVLMHCPIMNKTTQERLHFNPELLICDWPEVAGCE